MNEGEVQRPRWRIDPNVRLGDLLILAGLLATVVTAYQSLKEMGERNARDLAAFVIAQDRRDNTQDQVVTRIEGNLREGIQTIRAEQAETRADMKELSRFMRRGAKDM